MARTHLDISAGAHCPLHMANRNRYFLAPRSCVAAIVCTAIWGKGIHPLSAVNSEDFFTRVSDLRWAMLRTLACQEVGALTPF